MSNKKIIINNFNKRKNYKQKKLLKKSLLKTFLLDI